MQEKNVKKLKSQLVTKSSSWNDYWADILRNNKCHRWAQGAGEFAKKNSHSQLATKSSTWNGCWDGEDIPQARSKRSRVTKNGQNSQLWTCYWIEYLKRLLRWLLRSHTISEVKKESSNKKIQKFSKTNSLLNWRCETSIELTFAQQHQTWGQEGDEYPKIVKILKS